MTPGDAAKILAKAAVYDRREIGKTEILAWAEALQGIELDEALKAVTNHYATSTKWLMPAHIREGVKTLRIERDRIQNQLTQKRQAIEHRQYPKGSIRERNQEVAALLEDLSRKLAISRSRVGATTRSGRGISEPNIRQKPPTSPRKENDLPEPKTDQAAALAIGYLAEGYTPKQVSEMLGISVKWCRKEIKRFTGGGDRD